MPERDGRPVPRHAAAHGTTTAVAYGSVHKGSVDALLGAAVAKDMRMVAGKVMMDRNAPEPLTDTPQSGYDDTKALIAEWHGKGRVEVAVTPRFALTSTEAQMEMAGVLVREHPDCLMQTHLSENHREIATVAKLFPVVEGLHRHLRPLRPARAEKPVRPLHSPEPARNGADGGKPVRGRVLPDLEPVSRLRPVQSRQDAFATEPDTRHAIATDIGGGTNWSMLRTLDEGYKVLNLQGQRYHPLRSFFQATLGNAEAIGMEDRIGKLAKPATRPISSCSTVRPILPWHCAPKRSRPFRRNCS
jgi:guanine deaminase